MLPFGPILTTLRRHKLTAGLLMLQVALTFAIVCNAAWLIGSRTERMLRPSGLAEDQISLIHSTRLDPHASAQADHAADLATLRAIPGVRQAVAVSDSLPLSGNVDAYGVCPTLEQLHKAMQARSAARTQCIEPNVYWGSPGEREALGIQLVAGRDFRADEYVTDEHPPAAIITRAMAAYLYPHQSAVGQSLYLGRGNPVRVVGVVDPLLPPYLKSGGARQFSMLWSRLPDAAEVTYVLRSAPRDRQRVLKAARAALLRMDPQRIVDPSRMQTYSDMRHAYFRRDITMIGLLLASALGLLFVTALGIAGLASFWVQQRRRSIGVRRAVGATRRQILHYFLTENFLIVGAGVLLGSALAVLLNLWLMHKYAIAHLPLACLPVAAGLLWLLGQASVLSPALRAASVPPVEATRSV